MICAQCSTPCDDAAKFCMECGTKLVRKCASCGIELPPEARFCGECGTAVAGGSTPSAIPTTTPRINVDAERRQLTVMFCDLVGSTKMASSLDPEDMRLILAATRTVISAIVGKFGSTVIQNYGDGAMIMFGYPIAHEDAPSSAILAGLEILSAFRNKTSKLAEIDQILEVRIGINTGQAVVGTDGAGDAGEALSAIGDVPNMAARLQALAQPGQIVVSKNTWHLSHHMFKFEDIGGHELKGFAEPVQCYIVNGQLDSSVAFANKETTRNAPIISREAELVLLHQRWKLAAGGEGQTMLLTGEAGVGKSRILQSFNQGLADANIHKVRFFCSSFYSSSTLHPILNELRNRLGVNDDAEMDEKYDLLKQSISPELSKHLPVLARLFRIKHPDEDRLSDVTPQVLKQKTFAAIVDLYASLARQTPLLMEFEDLHWADPTTLEIISHFVVRLENQPWFLLLAYRPDFQPALPKLSYVTSLTLNRLGKNDVLNLIHQVAGGRTLPQALTDQIIKNADGIPLFAEEITRMIIESDWVSELNGGFLLNQPLSELPIPDSLQGSLMARLDRFPAAKKVAQIAAVFGKHFSPDLLGMVSGHDKEGLTELLNQLVDAELIFLQSATPEVFYAFKHALVRDAAYQSLLRSARVKIHSQIAENLEEHYPDFAKAEPEILGQHFAAGGQGERAFSYHVTAGQRALFVFANLEAINHLENALADITHLPIGKERDEQEFDLLVSLAVPQASALGYSHERVSQTYERAMELAAHMEDPSAIFPVIYGLSRFHLLGARYDKAEELHKRLSQLAGASDDIAMQAAGHRAIGAVHFYRGMPKPALEALSLVLETPLDTQSRLEALRYDVVDLAVAAHSYGAWAEWQIGRADTARKKAAEAIKIAKQIEHPFSISFALCFASWTHAFCGDLEKTRELSKEALHLSHHYTFQFWIGWAEVMQAWADAKISGEFETGAAAIAAGIEHWKETRSRLGLSYFLFLQADLEYDNGNYDRALKVLSHAESFIAKTSERFWEPEIYRLKGEVLLAKNSPLDNSVDDQDNLKVALRLADGMDASAMSLRALTSLFKATPDPRQANSIAADLQRVLDSFDQGNDTADPSTAREVLTQMTRAHLDQPAAAV